MGYVCFLWRLRAVFGSRPNHAGSGLEGVPDDKLRSDKLPAIDVYGISIEPTKIAIETNGPTGYMGLSFVALNPLTWLGKFPLQSALAELSESFLDTELAACVAVTQCQKAHTVRGWITTSPTEDIRSILDLTKKGSDGRICLRLPNPVTLTR